MQTTNTKSKRTNKLTLKRLRKAVNHLRKKRWQCRRCQKYTRDMKYDPVFDLPICFECYAKAEKNGSLRVLLDLEREVGVMTEEPGKTFFPHLSLNPR